MIIGLLWVFGSLLALLWVVIPGVCIGLHTFNEKRPGERERDDFWSKQRRSEQALFEQRRSKRARLDRQRLERELRSEQARLTRLERLRSAHFLLAIAVQLLPPSERHRYFEEFRAELLDVHRDSRMRHAWSLLRGVIMLRLRREPKDKAADAAVRRSKTSPS
jgi:hypothetical protein